VTRANSNMLKFICTDTCVYTYSNILAYAKYAVEKKHGFIFTHWLKIDL